MSRAALEVERAVREMRQQAAKERPRTSQSRRQSVVNEGGEQVGEKELTSDSKPSMTDSTDLSGQVEATGGNDAAGATGQQQEGTTVGTKKKSEKKPKAPKAEKTPKAPKAAKPADGTQKARKPRSKVVASGALQKVEASGTTYISLEFEQGKIVLTPTGNREANRDIAVKALRALLKG